MRLLTAAQAPPANRALTASAQLTASAARMPCRHAPGARNRADIAGAKALSGVVNGAVLKEAHAALLGVLLEAGRFDVDPTAFGCGRRVAGRASHRRRPITRLTRAHARAPRWSGRSRSTLLEENRVGAGRAKAIAAAYAAVRSDLRASIVRAAFTFPHVTGVKWRLDYYVKVRAARAGMPAAVGGRKKEGARVPAAADLQIASTRRRART